MKSLFNVETPIARGAKMDSRHFISPGAKESVYFSLSSLAAGAVPSAGLFPQLRLVPSAGVSGVKSIEGVSPLLDESSTAPPLKPPLGGMIKLLGRLFVVTRSRRDVGLIRDRRCDGVRTQQEHRQGTGESPQRCDHDRDHRERIARLASKCTLTARSAQCTGRDRPLFHAESESA